MKRMEFVRTIFLGSLWVVGISLLLCEGDDVVSVLLAKLIGLGVCGVMAIVGKRWLDAGKMPWTRDIISEE